MLLPFESQEEDVRTKCQRAAKLHINSLDISFLSRVGATD